MKDSGQETFKCIREVYMSQTRFHVKVNFTETYLVFRHSFTELLRIMKTLSFLNKSQFRQYIHITPDEFCDQFFIKININLLKYIVRGSEKFN